MPPDFGHLVWVALIIASVLVLVCLGLILFGFYKIKPALFKICAALWKIFTLDIEIRSPEQCSLPGKPRDGERPDPTRYDGSHGT
jgi:hypothetical protein